MAWFRRLFGGDDPARRLLDEARALARDGALEEAIERYDRYLESHREDVQAYVELSRLLVRAGREREAREFVLQLEPTAPAVLLAQGEVLAACEELEDALKVLASARDWYGREIARTFQGQAQYAREGYAEAAMLFGEVYAQLHPRAPAEGGPRAFVPPAPPVDVGGKGPYRAPGLAFGALRCPACGKCPRPSAVWVCRCGHRWNTFETRGRCPACDYQWTETQCQACHARSPHEAWYASTSA